MTIQELMTQTDALIPNQYSQSQKLTWLNRAEAAVCREILATHESDNEITFTPYAAVDGTELLIPAPYDRLYPLFLEGQIHYHNGEIDRYNNAQAAFRAAWEDCRNWVNRTRLPRQGAARLRLTGGEGGL